MTLSTKDLEATLRVIPDFPKPGISFKDITTLLKHGEAFRESIRLMAAECRKRECEAIVSPEARGFILGSALAYELGVGFVPVRKKGKLPSRVVSGEYKLEYGTDTLEMHVDALRPGQKVIVVDDVLATGGTISATLDLVERVGAVISAVAFLIELAYIPGRQNLGKYDVISVLKLQS
ncbi:MAG: adenine phosphoribosyltransferase [Ignavibacteriales bacterium]